MSEYQKRQKLEFFTEQELIRDIKEETKRTEVKETAGYRSST